jgi:hypothetical protein
MLIKSTMHLMTYVVILGVSSLVGGVNLGFGSLRTLEGQFGLLGRHTLLSVVPTYGGGPPDICSTNHTGGRM